MQPRDLRIRLNTTAETLAPIATPRSGLDWLRAGRASRWTLVGYLKAHHFAGRLPAIHRIALTQARSHPGARAFLARRVEQGATKKEALRSLKRRLSDVIYRAMLADAALTSNEVRDRAA